ncbi:hypothetical protein [Plantibacter sp. CFBP 13570]|uniref:hypothetical protein n=1 Tax=Plantibacter sp. CFBP 13570 TaxID=2775272 RepID=UPI0019309397|nr:hypothetical protein [Plantibacter sp. CFBP 13570]MBD8535688.1 hypothetical protein [Plantibacter sp. CFBP 13570]
MDIMHTLILVTAEGTTAPYLVFTFGVGQKLIDRARELGWVPLGETVELEGLVDASPEHIRVLISDEVIIDSDAGPGDLPGWWEAVRAADNRCLVLLAADDTFDPSDEERLSEQLAALHQAPNTAVAALPIEYSRQAIVLASEPVIALATLSSFNADLTEARQNFELAAEFENAVDERGHQIYRALVNQAVIAYLRCVKKSDHRPPVLEYVSVPEQFLGVHSQLDKLRNRTIAHSESDLEASYVLATLNATDGTPSLQQIQTITAAGAMPPAIRARAEALVTDLSTQLNKIIDEAKQAVSASLSPEDAATLWTDGRQPRFVPALISEWDPNRKRAHYPSSELIPMYMFDDPVNPEQAAGGDEGDAQQTVHLSIA